ncbi:MAG TPA: Zn-ribbon domain-containing OB-fold protein [Acidimicrobiia bacterium]|nr:Zn-ribbon domain-containing OB-fold protein [Acidimicrobiia bacterium]
MTGEEVTRPAPTVTDDSASFWEAARDGRLVAQRCAGCGELHHPPRPVCPRCHSLEHDFIELAGTGVVYSFALLHYPQHPAFTYPVIAVLVELDEGVRVLSNLVDIGPADVHIGLEVEVTFEPTVADMAVPVFRPRDDR